ncbi:uncharacterized protein LOC132683477 [Panthera onca]
MKHLLAKEEDEEGLSSGSGKEKCCLQTIFIFSHSKQEMKAMLAMLDCQSKHDGLFKPCLLELALNAASLIHRFAFTPNEGDGALHLALRYFIPWGLPSGAEGLYGSNEEGPILFPSHQQISISTEVVYALGPGIIIRDVVTQSTQQQTFCMEISSPESLSWGSWPMTDANRTSPRKQTLKWDFGAALQTRQLTMKTSSLVALGGLENVMAHTQRSRNPRTVMADGGRRRNQKTREKWLQVEYKVIGNKEWKPIWPHLPSLPVTHLENFAYCISN